MRSLFIGPVFWFCLKVWFIYSAQSFGLWSDGAFDFGRTDGHDPDPSFGIAKLSGGWSYALFLNYQSVKLSVFHRVRYQWDPFQPTGECGLRACQECQTRSLSAPYVMFMRRLRMGKLPQPMIGFDKSGAGWRKRLHKPIPQPLEGLRLSYGALSENAVIALTRGQRWGISPITPKVHQPHHQQGDLTGNRNRLFWLQDRGRQIQFRYVQEKSTQEQVKMIETAF